MYKRQAPGQAARWAILLALAVTAPFFFYPIFLMKALCFALFAAAFNLLLGYTGLLSLGHAAFMGSASYVTAYAVTSWGVGPLTGILAGTGIAALLGLVFGWLAIRRQGIYFAMVTLALAQMVYFVALEAKFTGEMCIRDRGRAAAKHGVAVLALVGTIDLGHAYAPP